MASAAGVDKNVRWKHLELNPMSSLNCYMYVSEQEYECYLHSQ